MAVDLKALLQTGHLTARDLEQALRPAAAEGSGLQPGVRRSSPLEEQELCDALAGVLGVCRTSTAELEAVPPQVAGLLPREFCRHARAVPLRLEADGTLVLAMTDPTDESARAELEFNTGCTVRPQIATPTEVRWALERYYPAPEREEEAFLFSGDDELTELFAAACADESEILEMEDLEVVEEPPDPPPARN